MPNDLVDATIQHLRTTVNTQFGDTWNGTSGTIKFFADYASDFALPYLVVFEIGETYDYMTQAPAGDYEFTSPGQLGIHVYQSGRITCRQLGFLVAAALNDAALTWTGGTLMSIRLAQAAFIPVTEVGPSTPTTFKRLLVFEYMYSGSISP